MFSDTFVIKDVKEKENKEGNGRHTIEGALDETLRLRLAERTSRMGSDRVGSRDGGDGTRRI
jgi:hypothetical protein